MAYFSIDEIKIAALDAMNEVKADSDTFVDMFRGMQLLIRRLEDLAQPPAPVTVETAPEPEELPGTFTGYGWKIKRRTYEKLLEARKTRTVPELSKLTGGRCSVDDVLGMLEAHKVPIGKWKAMAEGLGLSPEEEAS